MKIEKMDETNYLLRSSWSDLHNLLYEAITGCQARIECYKEADEVSYHLNIVALEKRVEELKKMKKEMCELPF